MAFARKDQVGNRVSDHCDSAEPSFPVRNAIPGVHRGALRKRGWRGLWSCDGWIRLQKVRDRQNRMSLSSRSMRRSFVTFGLCAVLAFVVPAGIEDDEAPTVRFLLSQNGTLVI